MASRKPGYVVSILLAAFVLSAPQILIGLLIGLITYYFNAGVLPLPPVPGFGEVRGISPLLHAAFFQGKFIFHRVSTHLPNGELYDWFEEIDAKTGETKMVRAGLATRGTCLPYVFGDRIWYVGTSGVYEMVNGVPQKLTVSTPSLMLEYLFLWEGQPAYLFGAEICVAKDDVWKTVGIVKIPDVDQLRSLGKTPIQFESIPRRIQVCHSDDDFHLFVTIDGRLYHRQGFEVDPVDATAPATHNPLIHLAVKSSYEASALQPANTTDELRGWSLVRETQLPEIDYEGRGSQGVGYPGGREPSLGILIEGQPAAIFVDEAQSNTPTARLYRQEGSTWTEVALQPLPFASRLFRACTTYDGQQSYFVVATATDVNHVYAIDATGFRETIGTAHSVNGRWQTILGYLSVPTITLCMGIILGAITALFMRWYTKPAYAFGIQSVELGLLGKRGLARLIDLGVVLASTAALGWVMTRNLDWSALVEAHSLEIDHPSIPLAIMTVKAMIVWLIAFTIALIVVQGVWGITPGKWLCRLKTVRTSLRPCGLARSLAREVVFFVDCCNFLCWTPGILSIAFTDRRQRLGDLVADTIVVDAVRGE